MHGPVAGPIPAYEHASSHNVAMGAGEPPAPPDWNPYDDPEVLQTVRLQGGIDQLAINNLRNIFNTVVIKSRTASGLIAYARLDANLAEEESDMCRRMIELIRAGFSDLELVQMVASLCLPEGYLQCWIHWLDVAYYRCGQRIPERPWLPPWGKPRRGAASAKPPMM